MSSELEDLLEKIQAFSDERDWSQFHTAKNLIIAVSAEVGELAEVVQWKSDQEAAEYLNTPEGKSKLSEEVADVAIYLLRICQQQNLNFIDILNKKMELNSLNYPIEKSKGSARKYTELNRCCLLLYSQLVMNLVENIIKILLKIPLI